MWETDPFALEHCCLQRWSKREVPSDLCRQSTSSSHHPASDHRLSVSPALSLSGCEQTIPRSESALPGRYQRKSHSQHQFGREAP